MYIYQSLTLFNFQGNEVILLDKLNPQKNSCNCSRIGIIKLFINLLKARVVTKPSPWHVAFIPYIDLAPRPNTHSFQMNNCSQFAWPSNPLATFARILCYSLKSASQLLSMEGLPFF